MLACVTGATGFLGAHLAERLAARGDRVRVTYRDPARLDRLPGVDVEPVQADVLDPGALRAAFAGADAVFHTAGVVGSSERAWEMNARAPRLVVEAAAAAGVGTVVLTSSVVAIGPARDGAIGTEDDIYRGGELGLVYVDSKHEGEMEATAAALRTGVELKIANPAYVLGVPLDRTKLGETSARTLIGFLAGRQPAVIDGLTNVVDVRDVAEGHLLVADRGRPGERYILGGENTSWPEIAERVARMAGVEVTAAVLPRSYARLAHVQALLGLPQLPGGLLTRLAAPNWQYSSAKAERELGYAHRPLEEILRATVDWFRELEERGQVRRRAGGPSAALRLLRLGDRLGGRRLTVGA